MSQDVKIDPDKLKALGRQVPTVPVERPPYNPLGSDGGIVRSNTGYKTFEVDVALKN